MNIISITIGDLSTDGHGHYDNFQYWSNKPVEEVRRAYLAAKERMPVCCPENYCREYEDRRLREPYLSALAEQEAPVPGDPDFVEPWEMAGLVVWFICKGDPELTLEPVEAEDFQWGGRPEELGEAPQFGYGLYF